MNDVTEFRKAVGRQFSLRSVLHWCIAAFIAFLVLSDTMQHVYVHVVEQAQSIVGGDE